MVTCGNITVFFLFFNLHKCLKLPTVAAGSMDTKAQRELLQRELFPPFGLLEKRLREVLPAAQTRPNSLCDIQPARCHTCTLTSTLMFPDIWQAHRSCKALRMHMHREACSSMHGTCVRPSVYTHLNIHSSTWHIYPLYKTWHKLWRSHIYVRTATDACAKLGSNLDVLFMCVFK